MKRRDFIKTTAVGLATPVLVSSRIFSHPAPSDYIQVGCIGVGRQGQADMMELLYRGLEAGARVVAVCDVDRHRAENAAWLVEKTYTRELGLNRYRGVKIFHDFRELLVWKDIDAVLIVTPDFWHGIIGIMAARSAKDIYLEKPLTYSLVEGQKLVKAVRKEKVVLQVGSQQRSSIYFIKACEIVRNGLIGQLKKITVWLPEDIGRGDPGPMPVPPNLDYDFWLGPTPEAPYSEDRVHPQMTYDRPGWMQIETYDRGMIANWGAHMIDIAQWGHGTELSGPVSVEAQAEFPERGLFNVHTKFRAEATYADGTIMVMETGDPAGVRFEGTEGWVFVRREGLQASRPEILSYQVGSGQVKLYQSSNHMKNFLECVRTRKEPAAPVEVGHRSNSICIITHIAMKLGRRLNWSPEREQFIGDEEANRMLDYPHRKPWIV
ncbi:MAG: Gfo/Idh/MocA family oxidoreductase [Candidatus Aminicenantes bacterium]|nr:Gfo/Idh/MocA family oxidoreductase [Candidatus Aminicenantes bacterium]